MTKVLITTSDAKLMKRLSHDLTINDFFIATASSGDEAIKIASKESFDLIILDSFLSDISGIGVCTIVRTKKINKSTPIIMLADEEGDFYKIKGIETGIDDYLIKPIASAEIILHARNIMKKIKPDFKVFSLEYKDLKIDMASYKVTRGVRDIRLGPTEFKILQCLMQFPKRILSREYIMSHVWGKKDRIEPRTVDVHINRLRSALKTNQDDLSVIRTIRSSGYCLGTPSMIDF
jgi:two-component system, OmpR family, phosphate regulon response regulator PhoB